MYFFFVVLWRLLEQLLLTCHVLLLCNCLFSFCFGKLIWFDLTKLLIMIRQWHPRGRRQFVWIYTASPTPCLSNIPSASSSLQLMRTMTRIADVAWRTENTARRRAVTAAATPEPEVVVATMKEQMRLSVMAQRVSEKSPVTLTSCHTFNTLHRSRIASSKYLYVGNDYNFCYFIFYTALFL